MNLIARMIFQNIIFLGLSLFVSGSLLAADCVEKDMAYAQYRNEHHSVVDKLCSDAEGRARNAQIKYRSASKAGRRIQLKKEEWRKLIEWHNTCFVSLAELHAGKRVKDDLLVEAIEQALRIVVRKVDGIPRSLCSGIAVTGGILSARHCFFRPDGTSRRANATTEYLVYAPNLVDQQRISFDVISVSDWSAYGIPGTYKPLSLTDVIYLSPKSQPSIRVNLEDLSQSYSCGDGMVLVGNIVSHEQAVRVLNGGDSKVSDSVKIGGFDSICVSAKDSRRRVIPHFCSSSGGQSGAPIFQLRNGKYGVVAIHLGTDVRGRKVRFNKMAVADIYNRQRFIRITKW